MSDVQNEAKELTSQLWAMANDLRGKMSADEFRDYILGFIFYRYLSDKQENYIASENLLDVKAGESINDAYRRQAPVDGIEEWREDIAHDLGYAIDPEYTWTSMMQGIADQTIHPDYFQNMFDSFKRNAELAAERNNSKSEKDFRDVFSDINLSDSSLGNSTAARAKSLSNIAQKINAVTFMDAQGHDLLGDVYEYLISEFASDSGKKAGEFYTPHEVSRVLARLVTFKDAEALNKNENPLWNSARNFSLYDPTMGSGSLLLTVQKELPARTEFASTVFYGQELNRTTYNLARMNLMMHGVGFESMNLRNADTLESDWPDGTDANGIDHPLFFDAVVANPPYSQHWDNAESKMKDPRFKDFGKLAPKSKADFAFVEHCIYHLKDSGRMAIVLPHGVLFRGAAEGTIRKAIIDKNYLDAVIGMPANLFYNTSIPTVVLVFLKNRSRDDIFFIDASKGFEKGKNQNHLRDEDIDMIIDTYAARKDVDKYAHVAQLDEIKENEYNLNIPRYVDTFEEEEPIDIDEVNRQLAETDKEIAELQAKFDAMVKELVPTDKADGR
ncbi:type I restriction-modification system subunit M [Bifidobacterium sp. ESL0682]|uniref:type I restriction-modification system subunit M n=1 Tax=Bifidobacterium sp. ESL0682 TaxID=2983212 RepID=UPI0023F753A9|nr:type I restriction-modification system subunit M [Bifidobacterium sp. ESL0682]WEV42426.1 type I restriction-modification system subunit M [Bifidobacterium sp. ESL0682]